MPVAITTSDLVMHFSKIDDKIRKKYKCTNMGRQMLSWFCCNSGDNCCRLLITIFRTKISTSRLKTVISNQRNIKKEEVRFFVKSFQEHFCGKRFFVTCQIFKISGLLEIRAKVKSERWKGWDLSVSNDSLRVRNRWRNSNCR